MKWIWSIGNKINDGHKALAVLTLNNLSFDASLLLLHDAPSVFTTLCSNSWRVRRNWQPSFHPTQRFLLNATCFVCYMYVLLRMGNRLTSKVHKGMFCSTWWMETFQPTMGVCHAVAWKEAESFTLQLPAPFKDFFSSLEWYSYVYIWARNFSSTETELGRRKYPLSKSDGGLWMELSEGS